MLLSPRRFAALVVPIAVALTAATAQAQDYTGMVRDSVTGAPIAGAVVMLLDTRQEPVARTLTTTTGTFRLRRAAAVTFRVIRIGYSPFESPLASLATGPLEIGLVALGNRLPVVAVEANPVCPERRDSRDALALWSAATDGLYALVVASDSTVEPGTVNQLLFDRRLSDNGREVLEQKVRIARTGNAAPIRAGRTAADFAENGYVERTATSTIYYAPDPEVLLDSTFATTHCLSLREGDRGHQGEIGVAFTPARGRGAIPDIEGVLWMNRNPLALRSLEFEYRGLDRAIMETNAGGRLDFETLSNGMPIIRYWHVRSPRVAYHRIADRQGGAPQLQAEVPLVIGRHETGGMIASGMLADGTAWSTPLATLAGRVLNSRTRDGVHRAQVSLDSTDYRTRTDPQGQFSFEGVLPGTYVLRVVDTLTVFRMKPDPELGFVVDTGVLQRVWRTAAVEVNARLGRVDPVDLQLPWREPVGGCYRFRAEQPRFVVTGFVVTRDSAAVADAQVRITWSDIERGGSVTETNIVARTAQDGLFQMCGVPAKRQLEATVLARNGRVYKGTASVPEVEYDAGNRRRPGNMRRIRLVVDPLPPDGRRPPP